MLRKMLQPPVVNKQVRDCSPYYNKTTDKNLNIKEND